MTTAISLPVAAAEISPLATPARPERPLPLASALGSPRNFLDNRFVYTVVSARARGFSIGVNLNPDKHCNFNCVYCEVNRNAAAGEPCVDIPAMSAELQKTLALVHSGGIRQIPRYSTLPDELLELRHVALSGDGEPTLCSKFAEVVQAIVHIRALGRQPFFKLVLITNATGLDLPAVQQSLKLFNQQDEIWAKLDAGTETYMEQVNRSKVPLNKILANILLVALHRPVIIQSLFPMIDGREPALEEIDQYSRRLQELKAGGAMIPLVQIYSATRPVNNPSCGHLPLKTLSHIAQTVRNATGLRVEVF